MSSDNNANNTGSISSNDMARQQRRGSVTSAAFTNLFRSNSISQAQQATGFPTPLTTAALGDQRRRLSISTSLGLSGTSPTTPASIMRRGSLSTNSDSIDENAIDEDDVARTAPTTPYTRRMSFGANQAIRGIRGGSSPGNNDQGFNWSEQLRSRAESTVAGSRPFSFASGGGGLSASPPRGNGGPPPSASPHHDRAKSVSDMPAPPAQVPKARGPQKPDHFQERILKGDFYMD
ncbi:hypothetical protein B0H63DRAFT_443495 [Podospora didyma]|uniref:Uncharacterized protein n=1 Tax=Podospora didyma TaxID=330526 RepID=A0AAE0P4L6_9PEZI|nr:hypothetical protein B0H63DRAFT_443495 [Podospora didyma]